VRVKFAVVMLVIVMVVTGVLVFVIVVSVFVLGVMVMIVVRVLVVSFKFDLFYTLIGFYDFEIWIGFLKFRQPSLLKLDPDSKIKVAFFKRGHLFGLWFVRVRIGSFAHHHVYLDRVARDLLAWALVEMDAMGVPSVAHVHDEILVDGGDVDEVAAIMGEDEYFRPEWAKGLPLSAEGYQCIRYRKG